MVGEGGHMFLLSKAGKLVGFGGGEKVKECNSVLSKGCLSCSERANNLLCCQNGNVDMVEVFF